MRSRVTAAIVMLAGAVSAAAPAGYAQSVTPASRVKASAAPVTTTNRFTLFPSAPELAFGAGSFSFSGPGLSSSTTYSRTPVLAPLTGALSDTFTLARSDLSVSLGGGFQLDAARWQTPASGLFDTGFAGGGDLFRSYGAISSPYLGLGNSGYYVGATFALSDSVRLSAGRSSASSAPAAGAPVAPLAYDLTGRFTGSAVETAALGLDWSFARWGQVGVTASQSHADLVGTTGVDSTALGIAARVGFGGGWVTTLAYNTAVVQLDLRPSSIMGDLDPARSQTYGIAIAKHGLFGDDVLGIAVSRPLQLFGNANFAELSGKTTATPLRPNAAQESDISLGYVTTFLDGALALQANAAYQLNANGDKGQDAVSVLSRAKIKF